MVPLPFVATAAVGPVIATATATAHANARPQTLSYPDGWLISEHDLAKLLKRREWVQGPHGNRQLDAVHDSALIQALRESFYVAGNVQMRGYGWDSQETTDRFRQALSPKNQDHHGPKSEFAETSNGSDQHDRHDQDGDGHTTPAHKRRGTLSATVGATMTTARKSAKKLGVASQNSVGELKSKS